MSLNSNHSSSIDEDMKAYLEGTRLVDAICSCSICATLTERFSPVTGLAVCSPICLVKSLDDYINRDELLIAKQMFKSGELDF